MTVQLIVAIGRTGRDRERSVRLLSSCSRRLTQIRAGRWPRPSALSLILFGAQRALKRLQESRRNQHFHGAAQNVRFRFAESRFEAILGACPELFRRDEPGHAGVCKRDQPLAAVARIDRRFNEAIAHERLQRMCKSALIHDQRLGELANSHRGRSADLCQNASLICAQAGGGEGHVVQLADPSRRLAESCAAAQTFLSKADRQIRVTSHRLFLDTFHAYASNMPIAAYAYSM